MTVEINLVVLILSIISIAISSYNLGNNLCKYRMEERNREVCNKCRRTTLEYVKTELKRQLEKQGYDVD